MMEPLLIDPYIIMALQYAKDMITVNPLTIVAIYTGLKILAKATPWSEDDKIIAAISPRKILGYVQRLLTTKN